MLYKHALGYGVVLEWVPIVIDETNLCPATTFSRNTFTKCVPLSVEGRNDSLHLIQSGLTKQSRSHLRSATLDHRK